MPALTFPYSTVKARDFTLDIVGETISGGITNGGYQQHVNTSGGGLWALRLNFPTLRNADQIRAWRVIQYGAQGGVVPINIAICDLKQAPLPSGSPDSGGVPHSDDSPFSDGSLYSSPLIISSLVSPAAIRATTVRVLFDGDSLPLGGEFFSLEYGDGYHELHVTLSVTKISAGVYDLTFLPPLRAAHLAGDLLNFDHPTGTFVLAEPNAMSATNSMGRWVSSPSGAFIEYLGGM